MKSTVATPTPTPDIAPPIPQERTGVPADIMGAPAGALATSAPVAYTGITGDLSAESFAKPKMAVLNGTSKLVTGDPFFPQGGISLGDVLALKPRSDKVLSLTPIHLDVWQQEVVPYQSGITPRVCRTRAEAATWGLTPEKVGELGILYCALYGAQGDMLESAAWESVYQFSYKQDDGKVVPICFAQMYLGKWDMSRTGAAGMMLKIDAANTLKPHGGPVAGVYSFTTKQVTTKKNNQYYVPVFKRTGLTDIRYRNWLKDAYTKGDLANLIADAEAGVTGQANEG